MNIFVDNFNDSDFLIFSDAPSPSHCLENSCFQFEKEYLDQFFENGVLNNQNQQQKIAIDVTQDNLDKFETDSNESSHKVSLRSKSKFHNYQKHLIITLRKTVKIEKPFGNKYSEAIRELWSAFFNSRIYNKSLLRILFGEQMMEEQLNINLFRKEGFNVLIEKYSPDQLIQAQHTLRSIVLRHFEQHSLDDLLQSRKLPLETKILFKKYISQFIVELKEGNVMKRLPKWRKKQILNDI